MYSRIPTILASFGCAALLVGVTAPVAAFSEPLMPNVLYYPHQNASLPNAPVYRPDAVERSLRQIHRLKHPKTVTVLVDSASRIAALQQYSLAANTPGNPLYHHFLSPGQVQRRFGPTQDMVRSSDQALKRAGWTVVKRQGFLTEAVVPVSGPRTGFPVSPAIWAINGLSASSMHPANTILKNVSRPQPSSLIPNSSLGQPTAMSLAPLGLNRSPVVLSQTAANGDVVSVMSFNSGFASGLPAGLPFNLVIAAQNAAGTPLAITAVQHETDLRQLIASYGASALPGSNRALWQLPLASWAPQSAGDQVQCAVTLSDGTTVTAKLTLPQFTGSATILSPLTAPQMNQIADAPSQKNPVSGAPTVAVFSVGQIPNATDLNTALSNSGISQPVVSTIFADGSTPYQTGPRPELMESTEDLQAVASADPGATILDYVYPANDTQDPLVSFLNALSQQNTAKIATISYGFFESNQSSLTTLVDACLAEGITLVESSGDQGAWSTGSDPGPVGLSSLEQVPGMLTVGGMDLAAPARSSSQSMTSTITGPAIAKAWGGLYLTGLPTSVAQQYTSQNAASTGGYGTAPVPSWQKGVIPSGGPGIGVPDIAADGGYPGLLGVLNGQQVIFGGTSLAAPLTAGWLAQMEGKLGVGSKGLGNINPFLYQAAKQDPSIFTQALSGSNGVYTVTSAQPGSWNPVTGLGMVDWSKFASYYASQLTPPSPKPQIHVGTSGDRVGSSVSLTASSQYLSNPRYQFWVQNPQNGVWTSSGPYSSSNVYTFTPKIPGQWTVILYATGTGSSTPTVTVTHVTVTSATPMVSSLSFSTTATGVLASGSSVIVNAQAADSGGTPVYQFWLHGPDNRWTVIKHYGTSSSVQLSQLAPGSYTIAVYALDSRQRLLGQYGYAYYGTTVINVGSHVSLSPITSNATANQRVSLTSKAANLTNPVYQYWIENPNGQWTSSGPYSSAPNYQFTPNTAGLYHVVVYAKDPYAQASPKYAVYAQTTITVGP